MGKALEGFAPEAMAALDAYPWPGNVRELENVVERAVALEPGRRVELGTLPDYIQAGRPATPLSAAPAAPEASRPPAPASPARTGLDEGFSLERHLQDIERQHLERALRQAGGVQTHAAELLGLSFRQFRYLAKKYGLKTTEGR
jgi:two-component system response regulator PilR (NtrC family)